MDLNNKENVLVYFLNLFLKVVNDVWVFISMKDRFDSREMLILCISLLLTTAVYFSLIILYKNQRKKINYEILEDKNINIFYRNFIEENLSFNYDKQVDILKNDMDKALDDKQWDYVINVGKHLSRLLLMLAKYDLRMYVGNCIVKAATQNNDLESQAMGYIDCIGWSLVKKEDYKKAEEYIRKGQDLIKNVKTKKANIMMCKGYRHLHSIYIKCSKPNVEEIKNSYEKWLKKISGKNRKIMKAYLYIINGDTYENKSNYEDAKKQYHKALEIFKKCGDDERTAKVYYKLGHANEEMSQTPKALKNYLIGFYQSDKLRRIDEKIKNCYAICRLISNDECLFEEALNDINFKNELNENDITIVEDKNFYTNELSELKNKIHV